MARFVLTLHIETEETTQKTVADACRRVAFLLEKTPHRVFEDGDAKPIRDLDGDEIGDWLVEE